MQIILDIISYVMLFGGLVVVLVLLFLFKIILEAL